MGTKFTAGPWRVEEGTTLVWGDCLPDDRGSYGMGYPVAEACVVLGRYGHKSHRVDEADANALLIAAAPTMAEALEQCAAPLAFKTDDLVGVAAELALEMRRRQDIANAALRAARGEREVG